MKAKLLFFVVLLFTSLSAFSQNPRDCNLDSNLFISNPTQTRGINCSKSSETWIYKYRTPGYWIPDQSTPLKTILVTFVICLKSDSTGGWPENSNTKNKIHKLIDSVNFWYSNISQPCYQLSCPPNDYTIIYDSKIRFELDTIIFLYDSSFHILRHNNKWPIVSYLSSNYPKTKNTLTHIFTNPVPPSPDAWGSYEVISGSPYILTEQSISNPDPNFSFHHEHLMHEYGHALGLLHNYTRPNTFPNLDNQVDVLIKNNFDFLDDVFGLCDEYNEISTPCCPTCANFDCLANPDIICPFNCLYQYCGQWEMIVTPLMSGDQDNYFISAKSAGRMHRALSVINQQFVINNGNIYDCVKEKNSYVYPKIIENNEYWDFAIKLYQDIIIKNGASLTISCEVRMPVNGKVIIESGGKLIIDGGVITSAHDNLWQGIEVWGNRNQHQYPVNGNYLQGLLVLKNGAVIENAREAVVLFNPNDGSGGYQTSGGIVQATDAVFRNNKRSAQFISYRNFHPLQPSQERNNASFFTRCTFEITQSLLGNEPFTDFVTLWDVRGVSFAGCTFQNNGPVPASPASAGRGIYSHNAHYLVRPFCPTITCNTPQRSTFKNLRVGIWASQAGGNRSFSSTHALFEHCQVGIVNDGVSNAIIQNNEFKPGSHPAGSGFIHTGLALLNTITNYTVRNNLFYEATNPTSPVTIGIWNSNTGISNKTILNNTYQNLFIGNHAQGLNRNQSINEDGLEFQCNTHLQGDYDFFVTDGPQPTNGFGIKPTQGSNQAPAGNKFSNNGNVPQYGDFNNASSTPITYFYYPNDFYQNPQDISPNVTKSLALSENLLCGNPITAFINLSQVVLTFNNYNQQYQTWKNLLTSLIDGGNTPGIKNRINTAPVNETLILRQELLSKAPYLSDEALKEAADRTELLPEAILFEVLLANPNALKSGKLMQHLRNKAQPLPDWMLAILEASKGQITLRTLIESTVGYYSALRSDAIRDIITWYEENDSLYNETEVRGWYAQYGNYQADMAVVESFIKQGLYTQAESFMQLVPFSYTLSDWEKADWENYVDFMDIYMSALQSGKKEHKLDSADIHALQQLADIPLPYTGSARARALLNFFYGYKYWEDPYIPAEKSMKTGPQNHVDEIILKTEVYPNPTSDWISFSYCYYHLNEPLVLHVINAQGVSVLKEKLSEKCGVHIIETSEFKPGLYTYYIYSSVEKLANGCFIKN